MNSDFEVPLSTRCLDGCTALTGQIVVSSGSTSCPTTWFPVASVPATSIMSIGCRATSLKTSLMYRPQNAIRSSGSYTCEHSHTAPSGGRDIAVPRSVHAPLGQTWHGTG